MSRQFDPELEPVVEALSGGFDVDQVTTLANQIGDDVHEQLKAHAIALPTVRAAVALGVQLAAQVLVETVDFGERSVGGGEDGTLLWRASIELFERLVKAHRPDAFER